VLGDAADDPSCQVDDEGDNDGEAYAPVEVSSLAANRFVRRSIATQHFVIVDPPFIH